MQDDSKSMPPGWWIVPGAVLGALSWAVIIRTVKRRGLSIRRTPERAGQP